VTEAAAVLVAGRWGASQGGDGFDVHDPATGVFLGRYPTSPWAEIDAALGAGFDAYQSLRDASPKAIASFLEGYADRVEERAGELARTAAAETGLPPAPRFVDVEIPRTVAQLREAAAAATDRSWVEPVLSPASRIASWLAPIPGVVCVFGPNNFPFAFNGVAGGDFAAAIATRHPVLAKANPGHPETTRLLAVAAVEAADAADLPRATVQMLYRTSHDDGKRLVADARVAATAYTGSRSAGLALKASADAAGKPIYLEMSSVNPVVVLPGAVDVDGDRIALHLTASLLLASGQFCTSPGLVFVIASPGADRFLRAIADAIAGTPAGTLLGAGVVQGLVDARERWHRAGATVLSTGPPGTTRTSFPNTVMRVTGADFLERSAALQTEAFGNLSLAVVVADLPELVRCLEALEGNLTGTIYAAGGGLDDAAYAVVAGPLRERVGRLLNDKVPTGVAVVAAMNHGGPFPATGHPGFTAVGIPASLRRFAMLQCFDNVPDHRLPPELQAANPLGLVRRVDDLLTSDPVTRRHGTDR
jgi:NADP-dependent aldehyde dehydrogenase